MGPIKMNPNIDILSRKTRSQSGLPSKPNPVMNIVNEKRKADGSPGKKRQTKRSAFRDLTNACDGCPSQLNKNPVKVSIGKATQPRLKEGRLALENVNANSKKVVHNLVSRNSSIKNYGKLIKPTTTLKSRTSTKPKVEEVTEKIRAVTVHEIEKIKVSSCLDKSRRSSSDEDNELYITAVEEPVQLKKHESSVPKGVEDFDAENWTDPLQASHYAMDIFNYLKDREGAFPIDNYMERQSQLSVWMRALLVDWMVEVQESFELNHETLYLAVKLVDLYLTKHTMNKETLQLLGAASIFIASKYDERVTPLVEDFLYICDGAYTQAELISMEKNIVKAMEYNLGFPLSYRFLRRYARCAKIPMPKLTLARYILELSLMDYAFVDASDSKLAAAALRLALVMGGFDSWSQTLQYYTGFTVQDVRGLACKLNDMLHKAPKDSLPTIRTKYSSKIFFEVAKLPLVDNSLL